MTQKKVLASPKIFPYSTTSSRGRSSDGRALDWQSRGQGFDPPRLHHRECRGLRFPEGLFYDHSPWGTKPLPRQQKVAQFIPMSVHNLLAKRDYRCTSPLHLGFWNVLGHCSHCNYLRQREQLRQTTPSSSDLLHMLFNTTQIGLAHSLC